MAIRFLHDDVCGRLDIERRVCVHFSECSICPSNSVMMDNHDSHG
jgi:hypothetical protein